MTKVQLKPNYGEDVRKMSFADDSFDVILSTLCLHNIEEEQGRRIACFEIARVLKPGGTALISDYTLTSNYAQAFREAGLTVKSRQSYFFQAYSLMWMVVATKEISSRYCDHSCSNA
jgi:arsenite methyltransferase